jgi:hypothetical protein
MLDKAWVEKDRQLIFSEFLGALPMPIFLSKEKKPWWQGGKKCFLGISDYSKAYKLYNPSTKKIIISRDVTFDVAEFWTWSNDCVRQNIFMDIDSDNDEKKSLWRKHHNQ